MEITVIIPTSYIPSHPRTEIIDKAIASIQRQLPQAPILITCDGLSKEAPTYQHWDYAAYQNELLKRKGPTIMVWGRHLHQSGMMLETLPQITTPLVLYLEHDWELNGSIQWKEIAQVILSGCANYVKFHAGNRIHPLHEHMMFERVIWCETTPLIQTVQYSANPHVASTAWYRQMAIHFAGKTDFIENLLHGPIANSRWATHKCMVYNPIEGDMKRAFHLDGKNTR